ncbi:preprotein translocase subunit YajC [Lacunimicrobium album]|jgi:preprotein translocase subunit YajC
MIDVLNSVSLLAADAPAPAAETFPMGMMIPIVAMIAFYYLIILRPESSNRKLRKEMLANLKKNDPVVTVHGIYGSIANISADSDEVTLKIDDNTRMRVRKSTIEGLVPNKDTSPAKTT